MIGPQLPRAPFLYPILDLAWVRDRPLEPLVQCIVDSGVRILQIRSKKESGLSDAELVDQAGRAVAMTREAGVLLIINDRVDVARIVGADGVHVGQADLPVGEVRRLLAPPAVIGISTHNLAQVEAAESESIDYIALGPIFPTTTKSDTQAVVGLETLRIARRATGHPLVAIGGLTRHNVAQTVAAGADGVALISDLWSESDLGRALRVCQAGLS